ncbi:MAG: response regulator transcription factor [Chloroflexi bacterium]|nr:response regulator transcription factor [Chloroflexota bacterium]
MNKKVRMVVVDDHVFFRRGLIHLLLEVPDFEVVGEAGEDREALAVIENTSPDVILLAVDMPGLGSLQMVQALRNRKDQTPILMLTSSDHENDLHRALEAGANGYLLKDSEPGELRRAILLGMEGKLGHSPDVDGGGVHALSDSQPRPGNNPLSDRELEVLGCMAGGLTTIQIGSHLFISENTVKTHIRHILDKLNASNRTEAVSKAIQMGLIQRVD